MAFEFRDKSYTYRDFAASVIEVVSHPHKTDYTSCLLSAQNPYYFAISLFATLMSSKVAILDSPLDSENFPDNVTVLELNDQQIEAYSRRHSCLQAQLTAIPQTESSTDNLAIIAMSSGTTGHSKGVMLSEKNVLNDMVAGMQNYEYLIGGRYMHFIPYIHMFGIVADLLGPLYSGGTICCPASLLSFFDDLTYFKPTVLNLPPAAVDRLLIALEHSKSFGKKLDISIKKIMCAGARISDDTISKLRAFGINVLTAYGLTECSPCVSLSRDNFSKSGSAGKILSCCSVRIINEEICVKGDNVILGTSMILPQQIE